MTKFWKLLVGLTVLVLVASACSSSGESSDATDSPAVTEPTAGDNGDSGDDGSDEEAVVQTQTGGLTVGYAIHADPTRPFWAVVGRGAQQAAADYGGESIFNGSFDPQEQAQLIEDFVAANVDGIVVSLANPDAMTDAIAIATEAGIPVITINSGAELSQGLGALSHVGQTETVAGEGAGRKLNEVANGSKVLCLNHQDNNIGLAERCDGLESTFDGTVQVLNLSSTNTDDLAGTEAAIQDALIANPDVDVLMALNPDIAIAALTAIQNEGSDARLATFDLSPDVLENVAAGNILFAIDQQQYLQGYLPWTLIYLYQINANVVGGGLPVLTGPGFVDADVAGTVIELAGEGTR